MTACFFQKEKKGFTLIEILVAIAVLAIISVFVITKSFTFIEDARLADAKSNLRELAGALDVYYVEHNGTYPADVNRSIPPGIEESLRQAGWPVGTWPTAVYDWDNWDDPASGEKIYQISMRFCDDWDAYDESVFPKSSWAEGFDCHSAVYYCVQGPCRSHISRPVDHPGLCVNCD